MNLMTSAGPTANTGFVVTSHNTHSVHPGSMSQTPLNPLDQPQVYQNPGNQPGLETPANAQPAQRTLKEGKTLGALQILIGLIHFGLASILGTNHFQRYEPISFVIGCPFWGGLSFIISGSLSVAAEWTPKSSCLLKGSVGMNIVSAVLSVIGICVYIAEIIINSRLLLCYGSGCATSGVLLTFSLLEVCIASTCAHFGLQLVPPGTVIYQTVYVANQVPIPEPMNLPPSYSSEVHGFKETEVARNIFD